MIASRSRASARTSACSAATSSGVSGRSAAGSPRWPWGGSRQRLQEEGEVEGRGGVRERSRPTRSLRRCPRSPAPCRASCRRWPRATRGRPRGPRSPAGRPAPCCRAARAARRPRAPPRPRSGCAPRPPRAARAPSRARARTAAPTPPAIAAWFSLMRIASNSPKRWFTPPARRDRGLLERPQPRRRLARVEDPRAGAVDGVDVARGRRRDAAQAPQQVQRRALGASAAPRPPPSTSSTGPPSRQSPSAQRARASPRDPARRRPARRPRGRTPRPPPSG